MNQILVTERIYVTPELKRKKKIYKFNFILSVILVCSLFSYYIYAEFDRNKNEEVSKEILASIDLGDVPEEEQYYDSSVRMEDDVLVVTLNMDSSKRKEINITKLAQSVQSQAQTKQIETFTTPNGQTYTSEAVLNIPSLEINYPIVRHLEQPYTSEELLKISLNKFWGGEPNEVGNYVIVGHNYKNKKMFGKLSQIKIGDKIELTDLKGRMITYEVYDKYVVEPDDTRCTTQETKGKKEVTLITCTNYGTQRLVVRTRQIQ